MTDLAVHVVFAVPILSTIGVLCAAVWVCVLGPAVRRHLGLVDWVRVGRDARQRIVDRDVPR